jgi:ketosteroid isomerase-like protein
MVFHCTRIQVHVARARLVRHLARYGALRAGVDAMSSETVALVTEFWRLMATNDFDSVGQVLANDFVLEWPQSKERIRGAANFARMNREYEAKAPWRFTVHRIVANDLEAVSDVSVTDGHARGRAISFFDIVNGKIARITEFWPEEYEAPANRAHLVETID